MRNQAEEDITVLAGAEVRELDIEVWHGRIYQLGEWHVLAILGARLKPSR